MRVKFLNSFCGPKVEWKSGGIYDVPTSTAERLIEAGYAVKVITPKKKRATKLPKNDNE